MCQLCEAYSDSIVTKILYTRKELVTMETSMFDFNQQLYTHSIQKLALHLPHVQILGKITVYIHSDNHLIIINISMMYCAFKIMHKVQQLVLHRKLNLNTMGVIYLYLLKALYYTTLLIYTKKHHHQLFTVANVMLRFTILCQISANKMQLQQTHI